VIGIGSGHGSQHDYEALLAQTQDRPPEVAIDEDDVYQVAATSGTTGVPKAAMMSHRNAIAAVVHWLSEMPVDEGRGPAVHPALLQPRRPAHLHAGDDEGRVRGRPPGVHAAGLPRAGREAPRDPRRDRADDVADDPGLGGRHGL
jgi:long-chain acyl-CoA synthetase